MRKKKEPISFSELKVTLRKARLSDKRRIFEWLSNSNLTKSMMGPPLYPELKPPNWNEFKKDYTNDFFKDKRGNTGRCFIIETNGIEVGTIGYDLINRKRKWVILDIWLKDEKYCGHGYGTDALIALCLFLNMTENILYFYISPSSRNKRAIKSYKKAGFNEMKMDRAYAKKKFCIDVFDYPDNVIMRKVIQS